MTNDKNILIQNVYYMLTYAFRVLKQTNYEEIASEEFDKIHDMFAEILARGAAQQIKQGLYREYITRNESLTAMKGKLDINGTIRNKIQHKHLLACEFDELSENNIFNQILKTTAYVLITSGDTSPEQKKSLRKVMVYFDNVDIIDPHSIKWNLLKIRKNNQSYQMLINICYFVLTSLLQTTEEGKYKMMQFSDEHMNMLYQRFVFEYFKQHHKQLKVEAPTIDWKLDGEYEDSIIRFLPHMHTDIVLSNKEKTLVIDTKYYEHILQSYHEKNTVISNNLYQIFAYVKNMDKDNTGNVSGMLLYAKTQEELPDQLDYMMSGNKISVKTLDLNKEFKEIAKILDNIANLLDS